MLLYTSFLGIIHKKARFTGTPPNIYIISNIDLVLTNQAEIEKQVVYELKSELDDSNIIGG